MIELALAIPLAVACVLISALCSGTEVAVFSIRRIEREQIAQSTDFADRRIVAMLERPRRLIATIVVGNEACNSVIAVIAYGVLERWYDAWGSFWLALAVSLPLIVLVIEITIRTLAAKSPLQWARLSVVPLGVVAVLLAPARLVIQGLAGLLLRPTGVASRPRPARDLSEEEFRTLVDAGSAQGQVDARERRLIHRVFEFNDKNVGQVMTPRERIFALSYDLPAQRLVKEVAARGFSRVPIYQKSLDNVRGVLNAKDLVRTLAGQSLGRPLGELLHEPLFVPRTTPVKRLFLIFKQKKVHMAIVVSEYGKVLGLVTMDDLLAQIFGVLRDERAELQSSAPHRRPQLRTPIEIRTDIVPIIGAAASSVSVDDGVVRPRAADDDLVHRGDERSGPVVAPDAASGVGGVLDPPPRPIHVVDEVTPPATDIADLARPRPNLDDRERS